MDPIHVGEDGKYYFWDELWANAIGPYENREQAERALKIYAEQLNSGCAGGKCE